MKINQLTNRISHFTGGLLEGKRNMWITMKLKSATLSFNCRIKKCVRKSIYLIYLIICHIFCYSLTHCQKCARNTSKEFWTYRQKLRAKCEFTGCWAEGRHDQDRVKTGKHILSSGGQIWSPETQTRSWKLYTGVKVPKATQQTGRERTGAHGFKQEGHRWNSSGRGQTSCTSVIVY